MDKPNPYTSNSLAIRALRKLLRPLVRAMIAQGLGAPAVFRILKQTYVEEALRELGPDASDSRISIITGVHRRDVKTFRSGADEEDTPQKTPMLATVIGRWLSDPEFTSAGGAPLPLPLSDETGPSFNALVVSISRDIRPRAVLDEMLYRGLITQSETEISLNVDALAGPADLEQKLHFLGHNVGDHMAASVENLTSESPPFLERAVFYSHLSEASASELSEAAKTFAMPALHGFNERAFAAQQKDKKSDLASRRIRFGFYVYAEEMGRSDAEPEALAEAEAYESPVSG